MPPFFDYKYRVCYSIVETSQEIDEIVHPAVREIFRLYGVGDALELSHIGDLPAKSGIGSSSAFCVGLINSLRALNGYHTGRTQLAKSAIDIEYNVLNESVGVQDQCAAAFGGLVFIEANTSGIAPREFITTNSYREYFESNLLMGFDGLSRFSGNYFQRQFLAFFPQRKKSN